MWYLPLARVVHALVAFFVIPVLGIGALLARARRPSGDPGHLSIVWGPTPIINIKYWSQALRKLGCESRTVVYGVYHINSRADFDYTIDDFALTGTWLRAYRPYVVFLWAIVRFDVFGFFYDGGFLQHTPLARLELPLLKLAGKKTVLISYGSDVAVPDCLGVFRDVILESYPHLVDTADRLRRRIEHNVRWADLRVRTMQVGYYPQTDLLWPTCLGIDVDYWRADQATSAANGRGAPVKVVHASNHRPIKGTDAIIQAVEDLRAEGFAIDFQLFERRSNADVRRAVLESDIVVEQLIGGYGLFAVEAMSAGRPVLSNLGWHGDAFIRATALSECPIVDTSTESIRDNLRSLLTDPERRRRIGAAGRDYVLRYHSHEAVGQRWIGLFAQLQAGTLSPRRRNGERLGQVNPSAGGLESYVP